MSCNCPGCSSDNVQSYRLAWQNGTSTIRGTATGATLSFNADTGFSPGITHAGINATGTTVLAERCAPPTQPEIGFFPLLEYKISSFLVDDTWKPKPAYWAVAAVIAVIYMAQSRTEFGEKVLGVLMGTAVGYLVLKLKRWFGSRHFKAMETYHAEMREWERSYVCLKCGNSFTA